MADGYQRVWDQAAGAQDGGDAGRQEARGGLQGAGFQPGRGGGGHGLADVFAADGRGQGDPADGGGPVLAAGHRPANPDGLFHHGPGVRAAFGVVRGEQTGPGPAGKHVGELPGEVVGVAQPGGQALADERRSEMGGVAEQEGAPVLEAGRQPGAEGVAGAPGDLQAGQVVAAGPGPEQRAEGGGGTQRGFVLAVEQPELPAVAVAGDLHERGGPRGVADLLHAVPGIKAGLGPDVDDKPSFGEPKVVHGNPGQLPDRAVRAVAAQHHLPGEGPRLLGDEGADLRRGPGERAGGVVKPADLDAAPQVDQRMPGDAGEQELFQVGLVEHVRLREAVRARLMVAAELGHDAVPGIKQAQPATRPGPGQELLADTDPAQDPGHLVVQVDGAGQRMGLDMAFEQGDGDLEVGEQESRGAPDWPALTTMTGSWTAGW